MTETVDAVRSMTNRIAVGRAELPAELFKLILDNDYTALKHFHDTLVAIRSGGGIPQKWEDATVTILDENKDRAACDHCKGIYLVAHAGKLLLKIIARHPSAYCEAYGILPEERRGFRPRRSAIGMMFLVRQLQDTGKQQGILLSMCFIELTKAYDSVHRTVLSAVVQRFGVPPNMLLEIRQFQNGMLEVV